MMTKDEVQADIDYHASRGGALGGSFWSSIVDGVKSVGNWLKQSGVGTVLADSLVPVVSGVLGPTGAVLARNVLKTTTGVGLRGKKTRKRLTGSSFMIN